MLPEELVERIRGFQESRVLLTAIELDVFAATGEGASAADVAARLSTDPRATEMLLNALAAIGVLEKRAGVFFNTAASREMAAARPALMHTVHLWARWSTLTDCVRAGTAVMREPLERRGREWTEAFIAAMHSNAQARAPQLVAAVGADGVRRLLDVGGGSAGYSIAFAKANPELRADVFDLAAVTPITERYIREAGLEDRVAAVAGDFRTDALGAGYDLALVSAICHMLSPEENVELFRKCRAALAPGGRVVVQDFILEDDKTSPRQAALFSLNMLVGTERGASYCESEYRDWLAQAGFGDVARLRVPGPGVMMGRT